MTVPIVSAILSEVATALQNDVSVLIRGASLACLIAALTPTLAIGQDNLSRERGIPVGRWMLAPVFSVGYVYDDNVFKNSGHTGQVGVVADSKVEASAGVSAWLPFRNSGLELRYETTYLDYQSIKLDRSISHEAGATLELGFGTGDALRLSGDRFLGVSEIERIDDGGELVFDGTPFRLNTWSIELERAIAGRRGYRVNASSSSFHWLDTNVASFFEYEGVQISLEYREPLSSTLWVVADYEGRSFDHFRVGGSSGGPFRREHSESFQVGVRGLLAGGQSFAFLGGRGDSKFPGTGGSDYQGPVWDAHWALAVGPRTRLQLGASRDSRPSFFSLQSHYVSEILRARVSYLWRPYSSFALEGFWGTNRYGDSDPLLGGSRREDRLQRIRFTVELTSWKKSGIGVSVAREKRASNYEPAAFSNVVVGTYVSFGWR